MYIHVHCTCIWSCSEEVRHGDIISFTRTLECNHHHLAERVRSGGLPSLLALLIGYA